jgi:hypothetical protein
MAQKRSHEPRSKFPRTTLRTPGEGAERCAAGNGAQPNPGAPGLKAIFRPRPRL